MGPFGAVGTGSEDVGVGELVQYLRCPAGGYAVGVLYVAGGDGRCVDERVQDVLDSGSSPGGDPVPVLLCQFVDAPDEADGGGCAVGDGGREGCHPCVDVSGPVGGEAFHIAGRVVQQAVGDGNRGGAGVEEGVDQ